MQPQPQTLEDLLISFSKTVRQETHVRDVIVSKRPGLEMIKKREFAKSEKKNPKNREIEKMQKIDQNPGIKNRTMHFYRFLESLPELIDKNRFTKYHQNLFCAVTLQL